MGHYIKRIIKEDKSLMPAVFSLAGNPNFVQFVSREENDSESGRIELKITVRKPDVTAQGSKIEIEELLSGANHVLEGTKDRKDVDNTTFFLTDDVATVAENIRACLMKNAFFRSNFEITIPAVKAQGVVKQGSTIHLRAKGIGSSYCFRFKNNNHTQSGFLLVAGDSTENRSKDSIMADADSCEIELDVYDNTGLFPGQEDNLSLGSYITSLSKSYYELPLWFDINAIAADRKGFSSEFLDSESWCNAGTALDYRFVAKRFDGVNREMFYMSDVCYVVNGYNRILEDNDLSAYVYDVSKGHIIRPLTKQLETTHIEGQKQYLNFILSNPNKNSTEPQKDKIAVLYKVYSQSGNYISDVVMNEVDANTLSIVNTLPLELDKVIEEHRGAGLIKVFLLHNGKPVSEVLVFRLLPSCLYEVNDFAFLNSLGGWSSFNFGGVCQTEFKSAKNTIFKTRVPQHNKSSDIESVVRKDIEEQFVVETMPVDAATADWLKEISASLAVYELSSKRYVVVDELNVKFNNKDDLFTLQMKYHYSDSYNLAA